MLLLAEQGAAVQPHILCGLQWVATSLDRVFPVESPTRSLAPDESRAVVVRVIPVLRYSPKVLAEVDTLAGGQLVPCVVKRDLGPVLRLELEHLREGPALVYSRCVWLAHRVTARQFRVGCEVRGGSRCRSFGIEATNLLNAVWASGSVVDLVVHIKPLPPRSRHPACFVHRERWGP